MKRPAELEQQWWNQARTEARGRLARLERGETTAPEQVVRVLRVFVADEESTR